MAVVINTNLDAIKIRTDLNAATTKMSQAMQRMSTGLKINSSKDDAAGSVISARMEVQLNGNKIAQNNVQNGNAMLSTAEGNIDIVLDNVSRIRDLTLQAKNGTYSMEEIQAMQDEVAQRMAEIDRVSNSSKYSQLFLFGSEQLAEGTYFQVGANSSKDDIIEAKASIFQSIRFADITGRDVVTPDVEAKVDEDDKLDLTAYSSEEEDLGKEGALAGAAATKFREVTADEIDNTEGVFYGFVADGANDDAPKGGWYVADEEGTVAGDTIAVASTAPPVYLDLSKLDVAGFNTAIDDLDAAIDNLTARKSQIGSTQNRLESAYDALTTQYENLSSAKSIITDADIALESSDYTQQQILQQVTTSLLAQANQTPSIALSLV